MRIASKKLFDMVNVEEMLTQMIDFHCQLKEECEYLLIKYLEIVKYLLEKKKIEPNMVG